MTKMNVVATVLEAGTALQAAVDVVGIHYDNGKLVVQLDSRGGGRAAVARFDDVVGFRVLDEGDLLEYWPLCSQANGWIYIVKDNGWFDNELIRPGFVREKNGVIGEYFVVGQNTCVNVLAGLVPVVEVFERPAQV